MLNLCLEWEWLDRVPKLRRFAEPDIRVRWETPAVITRMISALRLDWMRDTAIVAVATGMRESELFGIRLSQLDLAQCNAWITHERAKSQHASNVKFLSMSVDQAAEIAAKDSAGTFAA